MVRIYEENQQSEPEKSEEIKSDEGSTLDKYIHLTDEHSPQEIEHNENVASNNDQLFMVYTLTGIDTNNGKEVNGTKKDKKNDSSKSSDYSEGSKSPRTSHLFSFVSKLKKNRMEGKQIQESTQILLPPKNIDLKTSSKIPVHLKRLHSKLNLESKNITSSHIYTTNYGSVTKSPDNISPCTSRSSSEEVCIQTSSVSNGSTTALSKSKPQSEATNFVATSFVETKTASVNISTTTDLQEITEQIRKLRESEKYICDTIAKYINDQSFKIELKEIITNYIKQHIEAERKAQNLSHRIWEQQVELHKSNELNFKNKLDNLVKKNRHLHEENEGLNKKNDILSSKAFAMDSTGASYVQRNTYVVEGLNRANDKLRMKLSATKTQVETIDNDMQKLKERNNILEDQLRNYISQLNQNKDILQRNTNDHELELGHLYAEIKNKSDVIQTNYKAIEMLVKDLNQFKSDAKGVRFNARIDWSKINKDDNQNLNDVIELTRSYLKELHQDVEDLETEQVEQHANIKRLMSENMSSVERNSELEMQLENLKQKLKQKEELIINNFDNKETVQQLRLTLQACRSEIDDKSGQIQEINDKFSALNYEKQALESKIESMKEHSLASTVEQENLHRESSSLKLQLQELNSLLFTTGTANMSRDLKITQDQLAALHERCAQLEMDKKCLNDKIRQQELERQTLTIYQDNCYTYFQELQKEVEKITVNNEVLKTKLEEKKSQISNLQAERKRNQEEKEVLRQIYEKLKSESTKVVELEGTVTNINKEAVRLAKIAEYNKQLGEKLKSDVVERDEEINKLKNNLDKLNEIQEENVKEKVSLCEELTEICNWKDVLDNKLAVEVQRNMMLAEYRSEIENSAKRQIEIIEDKYLKQSNELDMLTDKYQLLESENEQFKTQLQIKEEKMLNMESRVQNYNSDYETLIGQLDEAKNTIADHNITIDNLKVQISDVTSQLQFQMSSNKKVIQDLQNKITSDSEELENMDRTIQYLQNNMQKMQNDLDKSREVQKEQALIFEKEKHKNEVLQLTLEQKLKIIEDFENERQKELRKIDSLTCAYNKLSAEYEADIKKASNEQRIDKENLDAMKQDLIERKCEIKNLKEKFDEQQSQKHDLQEESTKLQKRIVDFKDLADEVDNKTNLLNQSNNRQEEMKNDLEKQKQEFEKFKNKYSELKKKTDFLRKDLHNAEKCIENMRKQFKISFDELEQEFTVQKDIMYKDLVAMHDRVKEISTDYINQRNTRVKYEEAHKALAEKLLKSVKMLVEEKISRQTSENKILELTDKNASLEREQTVLKEKSDEMKEALDELKEDLKEEHDRYKIIIKKYNEEKLKNSFANVHDQESDELKKLIDHISSSVLPTCTKSNEGISTKSFSRQKSKLQTKIQTYKVSLEKSHKNYMKLQEELGELQEKFTVLEFQKSEMVLLLHETQVRLGVHENMVLELKEINKNVLTVVLQMREDGSLDRAAAETLIFIIRG